MRELVLAFFLCASTLASHAADDPESAFRGKRIAEANCATCHSIAQFDDSPLPKAPPFRVIGSRTPAGDLRVMLRGSVFRAHAIMPDFEPDRQQADDLASYIGSIAADR